MNDRLALKLGHLFRVLQPASGSIQEERQYDACLVGAALEGAAAPAP